MAELRSIFYELDEKLVNPVAMIDSFELLNYKIQDKIRDDLRDKLYNQVSDQIRFRIWDELNYS